MLPLYVKTKSGDSDLLFYPTQFLTVMENTTPLYTNSTHFQFGILTNPVLNMNKHGRLRAVLGSRMGPHWVLPELWLLVGCAEQVRLMFK